MLIDKVKVVELVPRLSHVLTRALATSSRPQSSSSSSSRRYTPPSSSSSPGHPTFSRQPRDSSNSSPSNDSSRFNERKQRSFHGYSRFSRPPLRSSPSDRPSSKRLANQVDDYTQRQAPTSQRQLPPHLQPSASKRTFPSTYPSSLPHSQLRQSDTSIRTPQSSDPSVQPRRFTSYELHSGLTQGIAESLTSNKDLFTTPIQSLSLAKLLSPADGPLRYLLGAETGSGKTLAFLLPLLHHLKATDTYESSATSVPGASKRDSNILYPRSIVLSPTHELTRQSTGIAKRLCHSVKLSVLGLSSTKEAVTRSGNVDVLFGTGGSMCRVMGLRRGKEEIEPEDVRGGAGLSSSKKSKATKEDAPVSAESVEWVIIDEADVLLGPDFSGETLRLLSHIASSRPAFNLILVTATLPPSLLHIISTNSLLSKPPITQLLSPGLHRLPSKLETRWVNHSGSGNKLADLAHEVKRVFAEDAAEASKVRDADSDGAVDSSAKTPSRVVVFCNSDSKVTMLSKTLESKSLPVLAWTSEGVARTRGSHSALSPFLRSYSAPSTSTAVNSTSNTATTTSNSGPRVLVTTSLLSRGLDFAPSVSTVFLLDPPRDVLDFVHRAGRAGRAGRPGKVVVFGVEKGGGSGKLAGLRDVVGKSTQAISVKPGGRTWSGKTGRYAMGSRI